MRKQLVPVVLLFVALHGKHLGHGVVDVLDATISTGVVLVLILWMSRRS